MSTIKEYIAHFDRNKSVDKAATKSKSPNARPLSKTGTKKPSHPTTNNFTKTTNITVKKVNYIQSKPQKNKTKSMQFEGELEFHQSHDLKISSNRSNHFDKMNVNHLSRKAPRKSPFQIGKEYQPKNLNLKSKIGVKNSNNLQRVKPSTNSNSPLLGHKPMVSSTSMSRTFYSKPKQNRSLSPSPMLKKKENNKLSPNLTKPKYISKSPILGNHSLLNPFKNSNFINHSYNNNANKIKTAVFKRPIQSAKRPTNVNSVLNNKNKQKVIISEDFSQDAHNTTSNKGVMTTNSQNNSSINTHNNVVVTKKEEPKPAVLSPKTENTMKKVKSPEPVQKISVRKSPMREKNQEPNILPMKEQEERKVKPINYPKQVKTQPKIEKPEPPKKILKKIKQIYEFTHVGFDGEADKENNQDSYFIYKNFAGHSDYTYMSVCDGHGVEGHEVSRYIKKILPEDMSNNLKEYDILKKENKDKVHDIIQRTFDLANDKLVEEENINSIFSGSTCVSVIHTPERLICPNIGDSRAVLGRCVDGNWEGIDLSRDHKPTEPDEKKRIIDSKGRIQPFIEDGEQIGPQRVWLEEDDVPGLAMTRSFGDRVAATVGVISIPEIKEFDFKEEDKFMIIASDGVWEFIPSTECVKIVSEYYLKNEMEKCCHDLYEISKTRWLKEEEVIDDITMIIVIFE